MITKISSLAFNGIDILPVDVQIQVSSGVPNFIIVGLADKTIAESKERVKAALFSIGLALPAKRILVNLSPADLIKEGSHFDLPIALGVLANMGVLPEDVLQKYLIFGELSLDGNILPISGALPAAMGASGFGKGIICSKENGSEAAWSGNSDIIAANNLLETINHFKGTQIIGAPAIIKNSKEPKYPDFKDIIGQKTAKRVMEVAAAGGHNLLMFGPPGAGKSMLAERLPSILPDLSVREILECSMISSVAGHIKDGRLNTTRPFRMPHHSCTAAAMVGGGSSRKVKPGEISLAHNGVLFLDELPEFNSGVIESLRQPLESRVVHVSRSGNQVSYPSNFQLIAAMNPCKCGYLGDAEKACNRAPICGQNYQAKISGPILDRFDLHIEIAAETTYEYNFVPNGDEENSSTIRERVIEARVIQQGRYSGYGINSNAELSGMLLTEYAVPVDDGKEILNEAAKKFKLSMRSYNKVLKVARTIADLAASSAVRKEHISEALSYRNMDY